MMLLGWALIHYDSGVCTQVCCVCVLSRVQLFVTPLTVACQTPLFIGFSRQELEWVAFSFSGGSSQPRDGTHISCINRHILCH